MRASLNPWLGERRAVAAEGLDLRTDHTLRLWGRPFLRLHYAMRRA